MALDEQLERGRKKGSSSCPLKTLNAQIEGEMRLLQQASLQKQKKAVSVYGGDVERYTYVDGCD